ncbi:hypothetical protein GCM10009737_27560 [Nocardioides lentus]|uniref:Sigma-70 family RNA polymerase sigma factor n=1 Tax=Nocardioides lentus TaxID=338077 RepID=A0ABN2PKQ3_9ACTN
MQEHPQDAEQRFSVFYRAHHGAVQAYATRRSPDTETASEVVAETFTVAWRRLDRALAGGRPWLFRTARHSLANALRAERRQRRTAARVAGQRPTASGSVEEQDTGPPVRAALASLRERDREVLMLAYWEDLDTAGLAAALGCTTGTAAVRLHRARRRLRDALDERVPRTTTVPTPDPNEKEATR